MLTATVPFDDRFNQSARVDDLSSWLMGDFLREVGSALAEDARSLTTEALGRQLNVVGGPVEAPLPKNVGLLFFSDTPEVFFPATQIDVVWFPNGAGGDRFEEKTFKGPLARQTRDAISYIERQFLKETVVKHPDRAEATRFWNFPFAAIEEAVVNAVYHRSYQEREPIEVRISPRELVVLSFPGPDRSIRLDDLKMGRAVSRRYRNRRIGEFLKELDLTEGRSTGVPKILRAMAANGSPEPEFETDEGRTYFLIRLKVHPGAELTGEVEHLTGEVEPLTGEVTGEVESSTGEVTGEVEPSTAQAELNTAQVTGEVGPSTAQAELNTAQADPSTAQAERNTTAQAAGEVEPCTAQADPSTAQADPSTAQAELNTAQATGEVDLLGMLAVLEGEMHRSQIQAALGLKHRENFRKEYLLPALDAGLIEMTIPERPRSPAQKYRITPAGRLALERRPR